jgi:hypothetical protein
VRDLARQHRRELGRRACGHARSYRPCRSCQRERRAAQNELDVLLGTELDVLIVPETFGLTAGELRDEGNRLVKSGWSPDEVQAVLAVERRSA